MTKAFILQYRRIPNADYLTTLLFPENWKKWKSYKTEVARSQALENLQRKYKFLEFRLG